MEFLAECVGYAGTKGIGVKLRVFRQHVLRVHAETGVQVPYTAGQLLIKDIFKGDAQVVAVVNEIFVTVPVGISLK